MCGGGGTVPFCVRKLVKEIEGREREGGMSTTNEGKFSPGLMHFVLDNLLCDRVIYVYMCISLFLSRYNLNTHI